MTGTYELKKTRPNGRCRFLQIQLLLGLGALYNFYYNIRNACWDWGSLHLSNWACFLLAIWVQQAWVNKILVRVFSKWYIWLVCNLTYLAKKSSVSNSPVAIIAGIDNYGRFWVFFIRVWTNPLYKADAVGLVIIQKRIISLWMTSGSILDTLIKKGDNYQSKLLSGFHHLEWLLWVWDLSLTR